MQKYELLFEEVKKKLPMAKILEAPEAKISELQLVHSIKYIRSIKNGTLSNESEKKIGFPWSKKVFERSKRATGATISACREAIKDGISVNLAGGTHHAFSDKGEGFCIFNDAAVAARLMQKENKIKRVSIVDLDVHQGNGTAKIFENDDTVFTLSLHGKKNFPFNKEKSNIDISFEDGTGDENYLQELDNALKIMFSKFSPDLIIDLAGADPHENDRLGRMSLTLNGLNKRDKKIVTCSFTKKIPLVIVMAGGYGKEIKKTVDAHFQTIELANFYQKNFWD